MARIAAPSSTENPTGGRDAKMKQSNKRNQWYFGATAGIGDDAESGLVHEVRRTVGSFSNMVRSEQPRAFERA